MRQRIITSLLFLLVLATSASAQRRPKPSKQIEKAPAVNHILLSDGNGEYQHVDYTLAPWANGGSGSELVFAPESDVNPDSTCSPSLAEIALWNSLESPPNEDVVVYYNCTDDSTNAATYVYYIDTAGVVVLLESPDLTYNTTRRIIPSPAFANSQAPTEAEVWTYIQNISPPAKPGTLFVQGQGAIPMSQNADNPATTWFYDGTHITRIKDFPRKVEIPDNAFADTLNQTVAEVYTWLGVDTTYRGNYWLLYNIGAGTRDNPDWIYSVNGDYSPSFGDIVCIKKPSTGGNGGSVFTTTSPTNATITPNVTPKNGDVLFNLVLGSKWQRTAGAWVRVTNDNGLEVKVENAVTVTDPDPPTGFQPNYNSGNRIFITAVGDVTVNQPLNLSSQFNGEVFVYDVYNSTEDSILVSYDNFSFKTFANRDMPGIAVIPGGRKIFTFQITSLGELTINQSMNDIAGDTIASGGSGLTGVQDQANGIDLSTSMGDVLAAPDINELPAATVASGDLIMIADVDNSNNPKKVTAGSIAALAPGATVTGVTDQNNMLDIALNSGNIEIAPDISEGSSLTSFDPLDEVMVRDNGTGLHYKAAMGAYLGLGFVTLGSPAQTITTNKNFTASLWQGTSALPSGSNFGSTGNTATVLVGGLGDLTEANFQDFGGLVIKTVYDGGNGNNTTKFVATGKDSGNDSGKFEFWTRDNNLSSNWVKTIEFYNTPSQKIVNIGDATSAPSGNLNTESVGLYGLLNHYLLRSENNGTNTLCLYENGGSLVAYIQDGQTGWKDPSDRRLKKKIKTISVLDKVDNLRGVSYTLKASGERQVGVIAQEIEKAFPEIVGTNEVTGLKGVSYSAVGAIALQGVVELKHENDQLKAQLAELMERMESLETGVPVKVKRKHRFLFFGKK